MELPRSRRRKKGSATNKSDSHSNANQYDNDGFYSTNNTYGNNGNYTQQDQGYDDTQNYDANYNYDDQWYEEDCQQYSSQQQPYNDDAQQQYDQQSYDDTGTFEDDWVNDDNNNNNNSYYSKPQHDQHSLSNTTTAKSKSSRFPRVRSKATTSSQSATSSAAINGMTRSGAHVSNRGGSSLRGRRPPKQRSNAFTPKDPVASNPQIAPRGSTNSGGRGRGSGSASFQGGFQSLANAGLAAAATSGVLGAVTGNSGIGGGLVSTIGDQYREEFMNRLPPGIMSLAYYKYYFRVDNDYVLKKFGRLLLPCLKRSVQDWRRKKVDEESEDPLAPNPKVNSPAFAAYLYQPAVYDINAPDFYLPLMFILSYIVIMGFMVGSRSAAEGENGDSGGSQTSFSPQILVATGSGAFVMMLIEVVLMKIGFYLIGSVAIPPYWLDLVCYAGYKVLFVIINLVINLIFPNLILYYLVSFGTGGIAALFMIQTLRPYFRDLTECGQIFGNINEPKKTKMVFLGIVAVTEILFIQWMGRYTTV